MRDTTHLEGRNENPCADVAERRRNNNGQWTCWAAIPTPTSCRVFVKSSPFATSVSEVVQIRFGDVPST